MCIHHAETADYLMTVLGLDDLIVKGLVEEDTRSRIRFHDDGIMVLFKAMQLRGDATARPEDMVSVRLWLTLDRVVSTREADVDPVLELTARLRGGTGPSTPGAFLVDLIQEHLDELETQVEMLEDNADTLRELVSKHQMANACTSIADAETRISGLLHHLGPQRLVLDSLSNQCSPILGERGRAQMGDALNRLLRLWETLHSLRDRINILKDQLTRIQERQLGRSSYIFAVVATVFLPLTVVTGLFGVNLMGLPFSANANGFWILVAGCFGLVIGVAVVLRWRRML